MASTNKKSFYIILSALGTLINFGMNDSGVPSVGVNNAEAFNFLIEGLRKRGYFVYLIFPNLPEKHDSEIYKFLSDEAQVKDMPVLEFMPGFLSTLKYKTMDATAIATVEWLNTPNYIILDSLYDFYSEPVGDMYVADLHRYPTGFNTILCNPVSGLLKQDVVDLFEAIDLVKSIDMPGKPQNFVS